MVCGGLGWFGVVKGGLVVVNGGLGGGLGWFGGSLEWYGVVKGGLVVV